MAIPKCWGMAADALEHGRLVLLYGPPGTGKTTAGVQRARKAGQELVKVTLTARTPSAELRGHWVPAADGWRWHHGPAIRAWVDGSLLLVDEIDHADEDALDLFLALFDDPDSAKLTLPSGETVVPHPAFRAVATMNGTPLDLPEALADRLIIRAHIDAPHPDAIAALPADLREVARRSTVLPDPERRIGLRAWRAFGELREALGKPERAAALVFGPRASDVLDGLKAGAIPGA